MLLINFFSEIISTSKVKMKEKNPHLNQPRGNDEAQQEEGPGEALQEEGPGEALQEEGPGEAQQEGLDEAQQEDREKKNTYSTKRRGRNFYCRLEASM